MPPNHDLIPPDSQNPRLKNANIYMKGHHVHPCASNKLSIHIIIHVKNVNMYTVLYSLVVNINEHINMTSNRIVGLNANHHFIDFEILNMLII